MAAADLEAEAWRTYVQEAGAASKMAGTVTPAAQLELLAMGAADAEGQACRECARQAAEAADEAGEEERVFSAEEPSRDAGAAPVYGMESIMAGAAYAEGWEEARPVEERDADAGFAHAA